MHHLRFCLPLIPAVVAFGCWKFLPGTVTDRAAFEWVAGSFANPPLMVSGDGTHASPWKLGSMAAKSEPDPREAPVIVSLGDDLEGFFQSTPPAPIDLAVIFSNFQRLGATKAATAAVLAWESPDPIGLAALDKALGRFESLVMAAPLSRGAVASPMPPAFRRSSIALSAVSGDRSRLPVVNRIPLPGVILGGEPAMAGFSILESEGSTGAPPLVARWDDRVVFAFPLLTVLQRHQLPLDGVEVALGKFIRLSVAGPVLPIDDFGCLAIPVRPMVAYAEISAEALIDGGDELFPKTAPDPVILRDDQTRAEPATRAFSKNLSAMVAAIASDEGFARTTSYPRLSMAWEGGLLAATWCLITGFCGGSGFRRDLGFLILTGVCLSAQWIGVGMASVWLPGIPVLAAVASAAMAVRLIGAPEPSMAPAAPQEEAASEAPGPEPGTPPMGGVEPTHPKQHAAKNATARPTTAKKAATPRKPRTKKPPETS